MRELWKPIVGYEGIYSVSNLGRVHRDLLSQGACIGLLHPSKHPEGYYRVVLRKGGEGRSFGVHILVAAAFIGPCPAGHEVNHKNLDKGDNKATNLEYKTHKGNMIHAHKNGAWTEDVLKRAAKRISRTRRRMIKEGKLVTGYNKEMKHPFAKRVQ